MNEELPGKQENFMSKSFLDIEKIGGNVFRSTSLWKQKIARSIYGGHLIGQSLVAALQEVPEKQHIHSLHSYFIKGGKDDIPVLYHVDKIADGKTYCTRSVKAVQSGTVIFAMQASFKQEEPVISKIHQLPAPKVPFPEQLQTITELLKQYYEKKRIPEALYTFASQWYSEFPVIAKLVEPEQLLLQTACYPKRHLWIKTKGHIDENQHQNIHKSYLAYFSDSFLLQTALLPLAPIADASSVFHTSLDHSMWFHGPCKADQWHLYQTETEYIGDGRALCRGHMWDTSGSLIVTVAQEGVLRHDKVLSKL